MKSFNDIGLLIARVLAGALLAIHGFQKLSRAEGFVGAVEAMGAPVPALSAWLLMLGEAGLGVLLLFGLFTRIAGALTILMFFLVYLNTYAPNGVFTFGEGGNGMNGEDVMLYMILGLIFFSVGAGAYSLDRLLGKRSEAPELAEHERMPSVA